MKLNQRHRMHGFSIVELMVAMTISLIILGAVIAILVSSKKNYTTQDSMARLQENARFAMQFIVHDLRMAGYFGCADDMDSITNTVNGAGGGNPFDISTPVQGSENMSNWYPGNTAAPPTGMLANTDALALRYLDGSTAVTVDGPFMPNTSAALHISGTGLKTGEIVMVTDCKSASMFQITGPGSAGDVITNNTVVHNTGTGTPGNATKDLGKIYEGDAKIMKFYYASYFIRNNPSGQPSLYRETLGLNTATGTVATSAEEMVEGVDNIQILYGEDTANNDRVPDIYRKANAVANWNNVVSVRVGLLVRTLANTESGNKQYGQEKDRRSYDLDADGADDVTNPNDRYERRIFQATVTLRNRQ